MQINDALHPDRTVIYTKVLQKFHKMSKTGLASGFAAHNPIYAMNTAFIKSQVLHAWLKAWYQIFNFLNLKVW